MLKLDISLEDGGRKEKLLAGPAVVGRALDCDVVIPDDGVSRRHCRVEPTRGGCVVIDLGSRNGCYVNGIKMPRIELTPGDVLQVGGATLMLAVGLTNESGKSADQCAVARSEVALPKRISRSYRHRQVVWDQIAAASAADSKASDRTAGGRSATLRNGLGLRLSGYKQTWLSERAALGGVVLLLSIICYQIFATFSGTSVPPPPTHREVSRAHRLSDD